MGAPLRLSCLRKVSSLRVLSVLWKDRNYFLEDLRMIFSWYMKRDNLKDDVAIGLDEQKEPVINPTHYYSKPIIMMITTLSLPLSNDLNDAYFIRDNNARQKTDDRTVPIITFPGISRRV